MKYIYIYVIAVFLWVSLPIFIYILSCCKRNQQQVNNERSNAEASEKNDTIIDRLEAIECATIIKTIKKSSRRLSQQHHVFDRDVESALSEDHQNITSEKSNPPTEKNLIVKHQDSGISIKTCDSGNAFHCHICLDDFAVGDKVRASRNNQCRHLFHSDCIVLWLSNQDLCPVCRRDFLSCCQSEIEINS